MVFGSIQGVAGDATIGRVVSLACIGTGLCDLEVRFFETVVSLCGIGAEQNLHSSRLGFNDFERSLRILVMQGIRWVRGNVLHLDCLSGWAGFDCNGDHPSIDRIGEFGMSLNTLVPVVAYLAGMWLSIDLKRWFPLCLVKDLPEKTG